MKIGVIGYGYWGPNLVRNFTEIEGVELACCVDQRPERRALVARRYPLARVAATPQDVLDDPSVEAVVIATPVSTHHCFAREALARGKHVLVEKPMTRTVKEAEDLVALAGKQGLVLMVDHTFIYTGAVRKMKEIVDNGDLGDLYYLDSVRINLGLFQHDVDVISDLAPHDLSILTHLVAERPRFVSAIGADHTGSGHADVAYMTVQFPSNFLAHLHVNWLSPVKIRQMVIGGARRMLVYNDMETTEKVRVYDRGVVVTTQEGIYQTLVDYRTGDVWAPKIDNREALAVECQHFVDCIRSGKTPVTSAVDGLEVVKLLEAAAQSLSCGGARVEL
jgi:predicted dehydrogenase